MWYDVCHSGPAFICASTPLTNRTKSTWSLLIPRPYGSSLIFAAFVTRAYGSWAASPASTVSSPEIPTTLLCWKSARQPVSVSAVTGTIFGFSRIMLSRLVELAGAQTFWPLSSSSDSAFMSLRTSSF